MQKLMMINKELNKFIDILLFRIICIGKKKIIKILELNFRIILLNINKNDCFMYL
jgi:hypothetical protein